MRTAQNSPMKVLLCFFRRLRGKRAEETGETNNDGVKTGSQEQVAIFEEQCCR
jgi:hypothetical protein